MSQNPTPPGATPTDAALTQPKVVRCADCEHCRTFREFADDGRYVLRIRCARGHWRRGKDGRIEATFQYHTVLRRTVRGCPDYASLSDGDQDRAAYLEALASDLPAERIIYTPDGQVFDSRRVG